MTENGFLWGNMSIFGKKKCLEGQGLQNIGHFQAFLFVCLLESSAQKQFVHRCLSWSTKMNAATPQTCFFSEWFLKKIFKLNYKAKRRYFPRKGPRDIHISSASHVTERPRYSCPCTVSLPSENLLCHSSTWAVDGRLTQISKGKITFSVAALFSVITNLIVIFLLNLNGEWLR